MPNFDYLFEKYMGKPLIYKDQLLKRVDEFPVSEGDKLLVSIESTNSQSPQGISIGIFGSCRVNSKNFKKGKRINMLFWEDSELIDPKHIEIIVHTKKNFVYVKNIWEQTNHYLVTDELGNPIEKTSKSVESWHTGAAMIVEEIENGRRYRCNDGEPDDDFDDIIFTIKNLGPPENLLD